MTDKVPVVLVGTRKDNKIYLQIHVISISQGQCPVYQSRMDGEVFILKLSDVQKEHRPEIGDFGWFEVVGAGNTTQGR